MPVHPELPHNLVHRQLAHANTARPDLQDSLDLKDNPDSQANPVCQEHPVKELTQDRQDLQGPRELQVSPEHQEMLDSLETPEPQERVLVLYPDHVARQAPLDSQDSPDAPVHQDRPAHRVLPDLWDNPDNQDAPVRQEHLDSQDQWVNLVVMLLIAVAHRAPATALPVLLNQAVRTTLLRNLPPHSLTRTTPLRNRLLRDHTTTDTQREDPHKEDPHKEDPHKADPHKADPHRADPHREDPHKANILKVHLLKANILREFHHHKAAKRTLPHRKATRRTSADA